MDNRSPFENPLEVRHADGAIVLTGPNGLSAAMTPEAAAATARRLLNASGGDESQETYQKPLG